MLDVFLSPGRQSASKSGVFIKEEFGLFGHEDTDLVTLECKRDPQSAEMDVRDVYLEVQGTIVDPSGRR